MEENDKKLDAYYRSLGINPDNFTALGELNVLIESFGFDREPGSKDKYGEIVDTHYPVSYMPRKERTYEWDCGYKPKDEESQREYVAEVKNAIERMKIWQIQLERQLKEIEEFGYPKTSVYYPEFNEEDMERYPIEVVGEQA